jgi:hypothetical protein
MGREATKDEINEILPWFGRDAPDGIQSKAGRLIDALQARALSDARALADELTRDLDVFGTSETRSTILEICDLLRSDAVFSNCERLSYLLLDLEQKLGVMPSPVSKVEVSHEPARTVRRAAVTHLQLQRAHEG